MNATGGEVCVHAIGMCGEGPATCFNVSLLPAPIAKFDMAPNVCVDNLHQITFSGTASANAVFIWDFNNPVSIAGAGAGPYTAAWALDGTKMISLTVIEPGCDTSTYSAPLEVVQLQDPVI